MTRDHLLLRLLVYVQNGAGVVKAYQMIGDLAAGQLAYAAISGIIMLLIASWKLPPKGDPR